MQTMMEDMPVLNLRSSMPRGSLTPTIRKDRGSINTKYKWEDERGSVVEVNLNKPKEVIEADKFTSTMIAMEDANLDVFHAIASSAKRNSLMGKRHSLLGARFQSNVTPKVAINVFKEEEEDTLKSSRISYRAQLLMEQEAENSKGVRHMHFQNIGRSGMQKLRKKLQRLRNDPDGAEPAIALVAEMKRRGYRPDMASFTAVILACQAGKKWKPIMDFHNEMVEGRFRPDRSIYIAVIQACEHLGRWEDGLNLLNDMKESKFNPDIATYQAVIRACQKCGEWRAAFELMKETAKMESINARIVPEEEKTGMVRSSVTFENDNGERVSVDVLRQIDNDGMSGRNTRGSGCSTSGSDVTSKNTSRRTSGIQSFGHSSRTRSRADSPDGAGQSKAAEAAQAINALQQAAAFAEASVEILREQIKAINPQQEGSWEEALDILAEMREQGHSPDRMSYDVAIACCHHGGQWIKVVELFNQLRSEDVKPTQEAFNSVVSATEKLGQWNQTLTLVKEMKARGYKDNADTKLLAFKACGRAGQWEDAFTVLNDAAKEPADTYETKMATNTRIWTTGIFKRKFRKVAVPNASTESKYNVGPQRSSQTRTSSRSPSRSSTGRG